MGLNNPSDFVKVIIYLVFLFICFMALEGVDYAKILRKQYYNRGILLQTVLSVALAYLVTNFFLAVVFKG